MEAGPAQLFARTVAVVSGSDLRRDPDEGISRSACRLALLFQLVAGAAREPGRPISPPRQERGSVIGSRRCVPVAMICLMDLTAINPASVPAPSLAYCNGALVAGARRLLFISGQVPETADAKIPESFEEQCRLAWRNVLSVLDGAGMAVANLVKVTVFLSDRRYRTDNARIRAEVLGDHTPALTIIITGIYDEAWLLEIEAIAAD